MQETIALYEERLSSADSQRYELEDRLSALEEGARQERRPSSPNRSSGPSSTAAEIDNEIFRDQIHHLQKKITSLEDMLEDAQTSSERDEAAVRERIKRFREKEDAMKKELVEGKKEVERMIRSEATARSRIDEIEDALQESTSALEDARAEVEGLRSELAVSSPLPVAASRSFNVLCVQNLHGSAEKGASKTDALMTVDSTPRMINDRARLNEQIEKLKAALDERSAEVEVLKKKVNRDLPLNGTLQEPPKSLPGAIPSSPLSSKYDLATARDEITGLKSVSSFQFDSVSHYPPFRHIVQELQKENLGITQRNKLLESENKLLLSETDQLRQVPICGALLISIRCLYHFRN